MKAGHSANTDHVSTRARHDALMIAVTAAAAANVLLHAWAALFPSPANWGYHYLAFYPWPVAVTVCALMALALVPSVQSAILRRFDLAAAWFQSLGAGRRRLML